MEYIIDGLNVCMWKKKAVSLRILLTLSEQLRNRGENFFCFFDANTRHKLPKNEVSVFDLLLGSFPDNFNEITGGIKADDFILNKANIDGAAVISNDRFRDYFEQYRWLEKEEKLRLIKGGIAGDRLEVPQLRISVPINKSLPELVASIAPTKQLDITRSPTPASVLVDRVKHTNLTIDPISVPPEPDASAEADMGRPSHEISFRSTPEPISWEHTVYHSGDLVTGKVVGITDSGVMIDFGFRVDGCVPINEFTEVDGELNATVGDTVEVVIRRIGAVVAQLSRTDALLLKVWDEIEYAFNSSKPIKGKVIGQANGGLQIDLNGVEAFLPGSQIDSRPINALNSYIGKEIEALVLKFSRHRKSIILSCKK